jgi:hypothetical protein
VNRFIIVGVQRTGSSALAESIGLHPRIACGWEWTQDVPFSRKIIAAERGFSGDFSLLPLKEQHRMAETFDSTKSWIGFRRLFRASDKWLIHPCLAPALWVDRLEGHLRWLRRNPDIHVIHIVRGQSLDWLKSVYVAKQTGAYVGRKYPLGVKVSIPLQSAMARVRSKKWVDRRLSSLSGSNPYLRVLYEDILKDRGVVASAALRLLECEPTDVSAAKPRLQKQSIGGVADYVANHAELFAALNDSGLMVSSID